MLFHFRKSPSRTFEFCDKSVENITQTKDHKNYLEHEKIENLVGLEIALVYEWELGSMLIFDRTRLHCSSSKIDGKKIGLTTFTKK